jgi:hypothetical protein
LLELERGIESGPNTAGEEQRSREKGGLSNRLVRAADFLFSVASFRADTRAATAERASYRL